MFSPTQNDTEKPKMFKLDAKEKVGTFRSKILITPLTAPEHRVFERRIHVDVRDCDCVSIGIAICPISESRPTCKVVFVSHKLGIPTTPLA